MAAVLLTALSVSAKVSLPSLVGDNMVLQRNTSVNVWGKAEAGAKVSVSVSWSKERYRTKADPDGNWRVRVATADAGGPHTMTISDGEPVTVRGIMLGEVWLCGSAASGSAASGSATIAIIATIRMDRQVEVNVGLALSDGLQHSSLCAAASHEVELGVVDQVLELLARLPLNLHLVDVLRRKLVGRLCAL